MYDVHTFRCYGVPVEMDHNGPCKKDPCSESCSEMELPICGSDRFSFLPYKNSKESIPKSFALRFYKIVNTCSLQDSEHV